MKPIILENESLRLVLCDPNDKTDVHLHTRFSHCGYILSITDKCGGRELLGQPTEQFHPFHGEGFPDEFEKPLGYEGAAPGGHFLKLGVGIEQKRADVPYTNWDEHPVASRAENTVRAEENAVIFMQKAQLGALGYAYTKTVSLEGKTFRISHWVKNTGSAVWDTLWYSHGFLPVKRLGSRASLGMNAGCSLRVASPYLTIHEAEAEIITAGHGTQGPCFQWDVLWGTDNFQILRNEAGETVYCARGDYACQQLQVYVNDRIFSVEPKLIFSLAPGGEKAWTTGYRL